ncbi:hypothetical protein AKJ09_00485 [Labilithrix luteola]|uniref:Uncharacterized protein n=2 Tax=Labilithrix luteola TaxID=1391654 RepID=A0A0K1PKA6_9BACT|nr:hypothetical protein AKJ09_00485 [Labilithrix luteola]
MKGQGEFAKPTRVTVSIHEQWASHAPFLEPNLRTSFAPHRVAIETLDGKVLEERLNPRDSFQGHTMETPWDRIQLAYFAGYAMWTYLTSPFSFVMPGFDVREVDGWNENGETWRGLRVKFPRTIATHSTEQTFYFGRDGLLRRHDYDVEVAKGAKGAHYVFDYQEVAGIMVPMRRRVYMPGPDNKPMPEPVIVSIDLSDVRFE